MSSRKHRNMPSVERIQERWADELWERKGYDSRQEFTGERTCFACGESVKSGERAHIIPKCTGGPDHVDNLHLLCSCCHKDSEFLTGDVYWQWFWSRNRLDMWMSAAVKKGCNLSSFLTA